MQAEPQPVGRPTGFFFGEVGVAATQCYLGASTPFGVIIFVTDHVYNARATVRADDGSTRTYRLPFLLAHGFTLAAGETVERAETLEAIDHAV